MDTKGLFWIRKAHQKALMTTKHMSNYAEEQKYLIKNPHHLLH